MDVLYAGFAVYAFVLIVTTSEIFRGFRKWFRRSVVSLGLSKMYAVDAVGEPVIEDNNGTQEVTGYDFISCAMCTGVWIAALTCLWHMTLWDTVAAYGISYFLKTQERP